MFNQVKAAFCCAVLVFLLLGPACLGQGAGSTSELEKGFVHPPASARPWVYWFPLDGNLTRDGITADLEAMKRVGIGGVLYMETDQGAPKGPAAFAGPLWRDLFKHICSEAKRLGLKVNMNNDAGWCGSGGPWIKPEQSMQRIVWTETSATGPKRFDAILPRPRATVNYYRDIAVFAFPTPASNYVIPHIQGKSAEVSEEIPPRAAFSQLPADATIARGRIVNLTAHLATDGRLTWDAPEGKWTILRMGHTSTGQNNLPAPSDGRGLECDKLSKEAAEAAFAGLMSRLIEDSKPLVGEGKTLVSTHIDSWEVGSQNWTPKFREEFQRLRGYDPLPFLPVMTGRVVDSLEVSERFLWDVRQTINDLIVDNYAGHFAEMARRHGMRLSIEAYGEPADDMTYAGRADEPMGEFWSYAPYSGSDSCTEMASGAHVYGKPILGAEAFTATDAEKWQAHPGTIKAMGDWAFCEGINRFVFHRYALQPWTNPDRPPGMSMGPWGLHYERTQTWWEQSKAWHEYLARCQYLLQQGLFVADLCFLAPEMSPQRFKSPLKSGLDRPGYNFDGCPPEVVLTRMSVKDGRLVLPDGMSYRLLVLPQVKTMTPRLLGKIKELVAAGATVVGAPPVKSPSLSNYPKCDDEVKALAGELWGTGDPPAELTERPFGKGRIIWGGEIRPVEESAPDAANSLDAAKWIWYKEGNPAEAAPPGKRYFRCVVTIAPGSSIASARLVMTADNSFECWINGKRAGAGNNHLRVYSMDAASLLKPGANLVAVAAVNGADSPNPAGLIGLLTVKYGDGRTQEIPTGATWEAATDAKDQWTSDTKSAQGWAAAMELGPFGMDPWGEIGTQPSPDPIPDVNILCRLLEKNGVKPDFSYQAKNAPDGLRYIHKRIGGTDVYFVANKNPRTEEAVCSFRVQNKRPELWWPDTGRTERPAVYDEADGVMRVPIRFEPAGSVFVVFRAGARPEPDRVVSVSRDGETQLSLSGKAGKEPGAEPSPADNLKMDSVELVSGAAGRVEALVRQAGKYSLEMADGKRREFTVASIPKPLEITGSWDLRFPPNWGAPERVSLDKLISWSEHSDPGVKHFSGTATYTRVINLPADLLTKDRRLYLDLGEVQVMAEVKLNGKDLGILWKAPFRVDVTGAAKAGDNQLEVKVVNLWINRMIGDEQLPEDCKRKPDGTLREWPQWVNEGKPSPTGRYTFTSWKLWPKDAPLQPSGLLGPVTIQAAETIAVR